MEAKCNVSGEHLNCDFKNLFIYKENNKSKEN